MKKRRWSFLLVLSLLLSLFPASALAADGHWADSAVETLNQVYGSGVFTASDQVMDADDARTVLTGMGIQDIAVPDPFDRSAACRVLAEAFDLPLNNQSAIQYLYAKNIINGVSENNLDETGAVTQAQFAVLTYRVLNAVGGGEGSALAGLKPGTPEYASWMYLAARSCVDFTVPSSDYQIGQDTWVGWVDTLTDKVANFPKATVMEKMESQVGDGNVRMLDAVKALVSCIDAAGSSTDIFSDVSPASPYYDGVMYLFDHRIISGKCDGTFDPNGTLTRTELAILLCRANNHTDTGTLENGFAGAKTYVTGQGWLIPPTADADAWWNGAATREDAIVGILKAFVSDGDLALGNPAVLDRFTDGAALPDGAKDCVTYAVTIGLLSGTKAADGSVSLSLDSEVTRGMAGVLLYRTLLGVDATKMQDYTETISYALSGT